MMGVGEFAVRQVSAGPSDRTYADNYVSYANALIGSGDTEQREPVKCDGEVSGKLVPPVDADIHIDALRLPRNGISPVRGGSLVASTCHVPQFDNVGGWGLRHAWRVRQSERPESSKISGRVFGPSPRRFSRVHSEREVGYTDRSVRSTSTHWQTHAKPSMPSKETTLRTSPNVLREPVAQSYCRSTHHWNWEAFGGCPLEDDSAADYAAHYQCALKWPIEGIAMQWCHFDLRVFSKLSWRTKRSRYLIKAKRLGAGNECALDQAIGYDSVLAIQRATVALTDPLPHAWRKHESCAQQTCESRVPEAVVLKTLQRNE